MKSDELVGFNGSWYFSSSTSRFKNVVGCKRLAIPVEALAAAGAAAL
jgi:hypothetical protein